jgi:hypothetical protein
LTTIVESANQYFREDHLGFKLFEKSRKSVENDEVALAFTISAGLHSSENIDYRTLFKPNNYVVVYEGHRLAGETEVKLNELKHETFRLLFNLRYSLGVMVVNFLNCLIKWMSF